MLIVFIPASKPGPGNGSEVVRTLILNVGSECATTSWKALMLMCYSRWQPFPGRGGEPVHSWLWLQPFSFAFVCFPLIQASGFETMDLLQKGGEQEHEPWHGDMWASSRDGPRDTVSKELVGWRRRVWPSQGTGVSMRLRKGL